MYKIFNWIFGSFFRTLGRILVYILLGFLLFSLFKDSRLPNLFSFLDGLFIMNVNAEPLNTNYMVNIIDGLNVPDAGNATFYNIRTNGEFVNSGYNLLYNDDYKFYLAIPNEHFDMNNGGTGGGVQICNISMIPDNYYAITYYFRTIDANGSYIHPFYSNNTNKVGYTSSLVVPSTLYPYADITSGIQKADFTLYGFSAGYSISSFTIIVKPSSISSCIFINYSSNLTGAGSNSSNYGFFGYTFKQLGSQPVSINDIKSSLQQDFNNIQTNLEIYSTRIQNSINNLDEDINEVNDTLIDINDNLNDTSPPTNLDSLNNSAGWLPAGPVDSILNLPLSFLTNLNSNLSKSCQPVNLPLPFVDKTLPLPCVNVLYNEIDGLPDWINIIGTIASAFILFGYLINLYKYIDDTLTFRENNYIDNWSGV